MSRTPLVLLCSLLVLLLTAGTAGGKGPLPEPDEGPDARGLTLSGTGVALVRPPAARTDAAIERVVQAARPAALRRAVEEARRRAGVLAARAGLTLGALQAVRERDPDEEGGHGNATGRHCFRSGRRRADGRRELRCTVPTYAVATVSATWATAQTSAAAPAGGAITAAGADSVRVTPRNRRSSPSIRQGILRAQLDALPGALAAARRDAEAAAAGAGMRPGAVFSIAEVRRPFDPVAGTFGPGRFCGEVRQAIRRRDPRTGRRRVVREVRRRRCFAPTEASVLLRVTLLPG